MNKLTGSYLLPNLLFLLSERTMCKECWLPLTLFTASPRRL